MSLVARMQQEGFLTLRFTPLAAALLCVVLTFGVESETHGNIACCCWEPWRGAAVCGVCLCLPTFSSHTNGSFERTLPLERPGGRLWMIATPHPSHHFLLKCVCVCGNFSSTATWFLCTLSTYTHTSTQMQAQFFQPLTSWPRPLKTSHFAYARGHPNCVASVFLFTALSSL